MHLALVVPGGVDRSGEYRVIPALLSLIRRLGRSDEIDVIALAQDPRPAVWELAGVRIHNVGSRANVAAALLAIYRLHRASPFNVVQSIWAGRCGFVAVAAAKLLGVPSVVHVAGGELASLPEIGYGGARTRLGRTRERFTLRSATAVSAASIPIVEALARLRIVARRIPLGVGLDCWPPRPPQRREPGRPARLLHVASLNAVKDQTTLLHALSRLAADGVCFEMSIVGEDTLHGATQALAVELGLSGRLTFRGFLTQRELRPLVEASDLLVISSRHEAGPLVLLEAAVIGVPSVGTHVGHLAEWAPRAALSVPVGDSAALAHSIGRVLNDEELRLSLAREAMHLALEADADSTAGEFRMLYAALLKPPPMPA